VLAVLYAVGGSRRHGLADALETLTLAAERGWAPAQTQLKLLAGHGETEPDARDWRQLRAGIDLAAWQTPPRGTALSAAPRVHLIPDFLGDAACRWLVERSRGRLGRALVYEALSRRTTVKDTRTNTAATFNLLELDLVSVLAQARMAACAGIPFRQPEPMSVLHPRRATRSRSTTILSTRTSPATSTRSRPRASASSRSWSI